jgi:radical SAM superfamily enzyme YgiQ (UPF0313 family)
LIFHPGDEEDMRVLLISGNREDADIRVPPLGLACIAASAENAGHQVRLVDLLTQGDPNSAVVQAIADFKPEAIGVSVRNIDDQRMLNPRFLLDQAREVVRWCKESCGAPIILGGAGFSILPRPILHYLSADMGIQGEGEQLFPELLRRLEAGESIDSLPGLFQKGKPAPIGRAFVDDLDAFPLPDPVMLAQSLAGAENAPVPVQSRRGCPMACSYCSTPTIEGLSVRQRSPESVVSWIALWVKEGFRNFYFVDNTFNLPSSYARQLCSKIIEAGLDISWRCILFPGGITPELVEMMARAGCCEASLGFESGSNSILKQMNKRFERESIRSASELLHQYGIRQMGFLLLGGPGETRASVEESLAFAESLKLDALKISVGIRVYPHTEVARKALEEGLISSEEDLLFPKFYLARGLEDWLFDTVTQYVATRPNWIF